MNQAFTIDEWAAFAPGLADREAWLNWVRSPHIPHGEELPALTEMPAMQRRRLERLGRMALQVAYWAAGEPPLSLPIVFASRHGDIRRTYQMLDELAQEQPLSPTAFGLSTHNAIAAQFSIATGFTGNYTAVAAGCCTAEAAIVEALSLLGDGQPQVLVVYYDAVVPDAYSEFFDEAQCEYAWALRLRAAEAGSGFSLECGSPDQHATVGVASALPHGLQVLHFLLSRGACWRVDDPPRQWTWRSHG